MIILYYQTLVFTINGRKYHEQDWMKSLNCLIDLILFQSEIKGYFNYIIKKHEILTDKSPVQIYVNEIWNSFKFRNKSDDYLELVPTETMKLLGSIEEKIVHCNIVCNRYLSDSWLLSKLL